MFFVHSLTHAHSTDVEANEKKFVLFAMHKFTQIPAFLYAGLHGWACEKDTSIWTKCTILFVCVVAVRVNEESEKSLSLSKNNVVISDILIYPTICVGRK